MDDEQTGFLKEDKDDEIQQNFFPNPLSRSIYHTALIDNLGGDEDEVGFVSDSEEDVGFSQDADDGVDENITNIIDPSDGSDDDNDSDDFAGDFGEEKDDGDHLFEGRSRDYRPADNFRSENVGGFSTPSPAASSSSHSAPIKPPASKPDKFKASVQFMITNKMRKTLIDELGYTKEEVNKMKPDVAAVVIQRNLVSVVSKDSLLSPFTRLTHFTPPPYRSARNLECQPHGFVIPPPPHLMVSDARYQQKGQ